MSAYKEGEEACKEGIKSSKNPYAINTPEYDEWLDGWLEQFVDECCEGVASIKMP